MKKFNFRLQKILEIREKLEQKQKNQLMHAASNYNSLRQKEENAFQKAVKAKHNAQKKLSNQEMSIEALRKADLLRTAADKLSWSLKPKITEAQTKLKHEQIQFNQAHTQKRSIEILKENAFQKYRENVLKEETNQLDELSKKYRQNIP